jgi:hypothetical protein
MVLYDPSPPWQMSEIGLNVLRAVCYHNTHPRVVDDLVGLHLLEGFPDFPFGDVERLCLVHGLLLLPVGFSWPVVSAEQRSPFGPAPLQSLHP